MTSEREGDLPHISQTYTGIVAQGSSRQTFGDNNQITINYTHTTTSPKNENYERFKTEPVFRVPFERDLEMIRRDDIIAKLDEVLRTKSRAALAGIGGVGKSQLAIEYCYLFQERHPNACILWVHSSSASRFMADYMDFARFYELPGFDSPSANILRLVRDEIGRDRRKWLLVLDNADDGALFLGSPHADIEDGMNQQKLAGFLPQGKHITLVVTTRDNRVGQDLTKGVRPVVVPFLGPTDAVNLLLSKLPEAEHNDADVKKLVSDLEYLPLAITQAAAFITQNLMSIARYLSIYYAKDADLQDLLFTEHYDSRRDDTSNSVIRTWKISFDQIATQKPRAAELLSIMAVLDRQSVPEFILRCESEKETEFITAIGTLLSFSLIKVEKDLNYGMHRLVQISVQRLLEIQKTLPRWQEKGLQLISEHFPWGYYDRWALCDQLLPHAEMVLKYSLTREDARKARAELLQSLGGYVYFHGRDVEAKGYLDESLELREEILGSSHELTIDSLEKVGWVLDKLGNYDEAEEFAQRVLKAREASYGAEHPLTLDSLQQLALVLEKVGKYEEAERILRQIVGVWQTKVGENHEDTLNSLYQLASVLVKLKRSTEAEQLFRQELEHRERTLGPDHLATFSVLHQLAWSILEQKGTSDDQEMSRRLSEAEGIYRRIFEARVEKLGREHPDTLMSMHNLASSIYQQDRFVEAMRLNIQVLELMKRILGNEHPDTINSMASLAVTFWSLENLAEAVQLLRETVQLSDKVLGSGHPDTRYWKQELVEWLEEKEEKESLGCNPRKRKR